MLLCSQDIELSEALCGFKKVIHTLDKRELVISNHAGDVIKHGIYNHKYSNLDKSCTFPPEESQ